MAVNHRPPTILSAMTPFPYVIDAKAPIAAARTMMDEHEIHHLPVTDGRVLVGVVSDRDILRADAPGRPDSGGLSVGDVFETGAFIVDVSEPLDRVLMHMWGEQVDAALVVKAGKLAGIFTAADACRLLAESLRGGPLPGDIDDDIA